MKNTVAKFTAVLGFASLMLVSAGSAYAGGYCKHGPHKHYHPYKGHYHDVHGHTYHTPEYPFIW
ncbi:MAG: hypothetical protein ACWA5U_06155 [bacterium]